MLLGKRLAGSLGVLAAAAGLLMVGGASAFAADLGGDCCADLEERVAELEATTVRKGNRKVSLTISGWVNEAVFFWDDGVEQNAYVGTNNLEQNRFRFVGEAKISPDWSAGYTLELGVNGADSRTFSQSATGGVNLVSDRRAAWFLKSKSLGKVTVGKDAMATYHLLDNTDFLLTRNVSDAEAAGVYIGAFQTRKNGALLATTWKSIQGGFKNGTPGNADLRNLVSYTSPTVANFSVTAAWGEDDMWDMALDYKNDIGDFKVAGRVGYGESTDPTINGGGCLAGNGNCQWWGASGVIQHVPTGLFVYGAYGDTQIDLKPAQAGLDDTSTMWYIQAGIEKKWLPLGKTNIFGEYRRDDVGLTGTATAVTATSSNLEYWAAGVIQNVEAADMSFYAQYRHTDGDFTKGATKTNLDDFDMIITGAKINF